MSVRFEKTYKAVMQGIHYPSEELISIDSSIPCLHQLTAELSQATKSYNGKGKMVVDKKPNGGKSPNLADAVVICYSPKRGLGNIGVGFLEFYAQQAEEAKKNERDHVHLSSARQ